MRALVCRVLAGLLVVGLAATLVPSANAQKRGGTLTIVRPTDPVSLEPNLETTAPGAWVYFNMLEGLLTLDDKMQVKPALATSYEVMSPTKVRFKLRPNVKFHDGTPLNAEAVRFTYDRALKGTPPARWASLAGSLDRAEVVDNLTVDIVTKEPYGPILRTLAMYCMGIVSPAAVQKLGPDFSRDTDNSLNLVVFAHELPSYHVRLSGPQETGRLLRKYCNALAAVTFRECPALADRDVHGLEVSGTRVPIVDGVTILLLGAFEINGIHPGFAKSGELSDDSEVLHSVNGANAGEDTLIKLIDHRVRVRIADKLDIHGQYLRGVESFIDVQQSVEAYTQKARDDQQRCAQRDLEADQTFTKPQAAASFSDGVASGAQCFLRIIACQPPGRKRAEHQAGQTGKSECERDDARIHPNLLESWNIQRRRGCEHLHQQAGK